MNKLIPLVIALCTMFITFNAQAKLENFYNCTMNEGVTAQQVIALKNDYNAAAKEAGLDTYSIKVMFPMYGEQQGPGALAWSGSWESLEDMPQISSWFRASKWGAKVLKLMTCENGSLWNVYD